MPGRGGSPDGHPVRGVEVGLRTGQSPGNGRIDEAEVQGLSYMSFGSRGFQASLVTVGPNPGPRPACRVGLEELSASPMIPGGALLVLRQTARG